MIKKINIKNVVQTRWNFALGLLSSGNPFQLTCLRKISKRRRTVNSLEKLVEFRKRDWNFNRMYFNYDKSSVLREKSLNLVDY